ncbi:P-loop containing nucleoside triphosphate hydrolase protein [Lasiosphaeria ovina]|uniref:P-loop containing nucleoside triphosphate hydrolase protein n=1 Tax=Lasiosphaeria ovina TaxID=92902 RepID=A0AAE0N1Z5_9PEZI|nr:P-loop containing nucleoside triphosphate hydrolase protein [Lasiosphaeria ovina]
MPRKLFIQMSGAPGSGKSTTSKLVGNSIDGVVIDHDILKSSLLEDGILSFDQAAKAAYRIDWALADTLMEQGRSVVLDCPCNYQAVIDNGTALARKHGFAYWYVECKVNDIDLLNARLQQRVPMRSQRTEVDSLPPDAAAGTQDARELFRRWIDSPYSPVENVIVVDSSGILSREQCRDAILRHIQFASGQQDQRTIKAPLRQLGLE